MDLLYAGVFDNISLATLAEVVRDPAAKESAIREVATYTQTGLETRKLGGLHFSFSLCASNGSGRSLIVCLASRGHSSKLTQQLIEAIGRSAQPHMAAASTEQAAGPSLQKGLESIVERYVGDSVMLLKGERLEGLSEHLDKLKQAAVSNVEEMLDRKEKIDVLVSRTDKLAVNTGAFKRSAKVLRQTHEWKNKQGWMAMGAVAFVLLVIYFAVRA